MFREREKNIFYTELLMFHAKDTNFEEQRQIKHYYYMRDKWYIMKKMNNEGFPRYIYREGWSKFYILKLFLCIIS